MLPLMKVLSLIIRVFSKPIINYSKQYTMHNHEYKHQWLRKFFVRLGEKYNSIEQKMNRQYLNLQTKGDFFIKPISETVALEKGIEFFYECLLYTILLSLPIIEMYKSHKDAQVKSKALSEQFADINLKLDQLQENQKIQNEESSSQIEKYNFQIHRLETEINQQKIILNEILLTQQQKDNIMQSIQNDLIKQIEKYQNNEKQKE